MANQRLMREHSMMIMEDCMYLLGNVLDEEEELQARDGLYEIILAGIEAYALQSDRMRQRLRPLEN